MCEKYMANNFLKWLGCWRGGGGQALPFVEVLIALAGLALFRWLLKKACK